MSGAPRLHIRLEFQFPGSRQHFCWRPNSLIPVSAPRRVAADSCRSLPARLRGNALSLTG